jgi:transposase InsO family protein
MKFASFWRRKVYVPKPRCPRPHRAVKKLAALAVIVLMAHLIPNHVVPTRPPAISEAPHTSGGGGGRRTRHQQQASTLTGATSAISGASSSTLTSSANGGEDPPPDERPVSLPSAHAQDLPPPSRKRSHPEKSLSISPAELAEATLQDEYPPTNEVAETERMLSIVSPRTRNLLTDHRITPTILDELSRTDLLSIRVPLGDIVLLERFALQRQGHNATIRKDHPAIHPMCFKHKPPSTSDVTKTPSTFDIPTDHTMLHSSFPSTPETPYTPYTIGTTPGLQPRRYKTTLPSNLPVWDPDTSPGSARDFIVRLKLALRSQDYDPVKWHVALILQMRGNASLFAERLAKIKPLDWKTAKRRFIEHFTLADETRDEWKQYSNLTQFPAEHVREYGDRFIRSALRLDRDFTDPGVIYHFTRGLRPEVQSLLTAVELVHPSTNLNDAIKKAIGLETSTRHDRPRHSPGTSKTRTPPANGCQTHYWLKPGNPKFHSDAECQNPSSKRPSSQTTPGSAATKTPSTAPTTPATPATPLPTTTPISQAAGLKTPSSSTTNQFSPNTTSKTRFPRGTCYNCGAPDHMANACPKPSLFEIDDGSLQADEEQVSNAAELLEILDHGSTDPVIIPVVVAGIPADALIDSGATPSYMNRELAEQHGIKYGASSSDTTVKLAGQQTSLQIFGRTDELSLVTANGSITTRFLVANIRHPIILGRPDYPRLGIGFYGLPSARPGLHAPTPAAPDIPQPTCQGSVEHPARAEVLSAIEPLLTANEHVSGFVPLPEAEVRLELTNRTPLYQRQYKIAQRFHQTVTETINGWLQRGVIKQVKPSGWNSPLNVSQKKDFDTGLRMDDPKNVRVNFDGRGINRRLPDYSFEIPIISEIFDRVGGAVIYSSIDLKDAFCSFKVREEDQEVLSFSWDGKHYQWIGAPFGLKILSFQFQRVMATLFSHLPFVSVFIDDVCIFSQSLEEHIIHVKQVIQILTDNNFKINRQKSCFGYVAIYLLGHRISASGIEIDRRKLAGIDRWPQPTAETINHHLGLLNYFRNFVPNFAALVSPLNQLKREFSWGPAQDQAWSSVKEALILSPVIHLPEWHRKFYVATDASNVGIGAALFQKFDDSLPSTTANAANHRYLSFASRSLQDAERRYSATKKEALGVVFSLNKFRPYLLGRKFTVYTDHQALTWLFTQYDKDRLTNTWFDTVMEFEFEVIHRPGIHNILPDALSRLYSPHHRTVLELWGGEQRESSASLENAADPDQAIPSHHSILIIETSANPTSKNTGHSVANPTSDNLLTSSSDIPPRSVTDPAERTKLLRDHHEFGHFGGLALAKSILRSGVSWPGIFLDCATHVAGCRDCQRFTITRRGFHPLQPILAKMPWDHISFDLFQLHTSPDGFNYVLIIVDICTRFCLLRPIAVKSKQAVAAALFGVFCDFGFPRILQSDNGKEFVNSIVHEMKHTMCQEHRTITAYHPRANGASERFVRTAKDCILKQLRGAETEWPAKIPLVQLQMNWKAAALHGSSPFSLFFGRHFNFFGNYSECISDPASLEQLQQRIAHLTEVVFPATFERSAATQDSRKSQFDTSHLLIDIPIGSYVMTKVDVPKGKGSARYEGPFKVLRRTRGGSYELQDLDGLLMPRKYAPSQLKPINPSDHEETEEPSYRVEKILSDKQEGGIRFYLVKWEGYEDSSNSWVAESDFDDIEIIRNYWKEKITTSKSHRRSGNKR